MADKAGDAIQVARKMMRKFLALALAGRKAEMTAAWGRLGFVVDEDGVALGNGVDLDFLPPGEASLVGFSGEADAHLSERPSAIFGGECHFTLAPTRKIRVPVHLNGAIGLSSAAFLADDPADHAELLSKVTGQRAMLATSAGLEIDLGGQRLLVLTPAAFAFRFGGAAPANCGFRLGGLTFQVASLGWTEKVLHAKGVATKIQAGRLLAGDSEDLGAALAFETN
jgi:hypothetical protein